MEAGSAKAPTTAGAALHGCGVSQKRYINKVNEWGDTKKGFTKVNNDGKMCKQIRIRVVQSDRVKMEYAAKKKIEVIRPNPCLKKNVDNNLAWIGGRQKVITWMAPFIHELII